MRCAHRAGPSKTWLKVNNRAPPSSARVKDAIEWGDFDGDRDALVMGPLQSKQR